MRNAKCKNRLEDGEKVANLLLKDSKHKHGKEKMENGTKLNEESPQT